MKRGMFRVGCVVVALLAVGASSTAGSKPVDAALKQVSKATKGLTGLVAEVEYSEIISKRSVSGSGKFYVHFGGLLRAEVGGDTPQEMILFPPYLYVHRINARTVDIYDVMASPGMLGQYLLLGFMPAGKAMKKEFDVQLVENATLDGKPVFNFLMVPKSKDLTRSVARIQLWVDPETGLPLQHKIFHASGETQLEVRYVSITLDDELSVSLFQPDWPDGVEQIQR